MINYMCQNESGSNKTQEESSIKIVCVSLHLDIIAVLKLQKEILNKHKL